MYKGYLHAKFLAKWLFQLNLIFLSSPHVSNSNSVYCLPLLQSLCAGIWVPGFDANFITNPPTVVLAIFAKKPEPKVLQSY